MFALKLPVASGVFLETRRAPNLPSLRRRCTYASPIKMYVGRTCSETALNTRALSEDVRAHQAGDYISVNVCVCSRVDALMR